MGVNVEFVSPARFALSGPGIREWRARSSIWVDGAEHSKMFQKCGKCGRTLLRSGQHSTTPDDGHAGWRIWDGKTGPGVWERGNTGRLLLGRGFLPKVLSELPVSSVTGLQPLAEIPLLTVDNLRDYQLEALQLMFAHKWGRIALPTNAGKGAIIALAAHSLSLAQRRTLILCDEIAVFQALEKEIPVWTGHSPYLVNSGVQNQPDKLITLAMVPTLVRRVEKWSKWLHSVDAVLLDEADKASAATWQRILSHTPNSHIRIGFSGTFIEGEVSVPEMTCLETIGPVLARRTNMDLIERGISARPFVELVPYNNHIRLTNEFWDLPGPEKKGYIYNIGVVMNEDRHALIKDLLDPNEPNAIIVNYVEHGEQLERYLPSSVFLHGGDKADRRKRVLDSYKKGEFQNLIVTRILDRGTNELGLVVGLILASAEGSPRQTLQRIGRGLRRTGGKEFLFLKDIVDRGHVYFKSQSVRRIKLYNSEGFDITIRSNH